MERYAKITKKDPREIVLLIGNGCKWKKCKFCNYYLDQNQNEEEQYKINQEVLAKVTGEFGKLEAINSGSIFELNEKSQEELLNTCKEKQIKTLIIESHYMYQKKIKEWKETYKTYGIDLKIKGGLETLDEDFREEVMKKGFGRPTLEQLKNIFDEINLLVGVKGQTIEQVEKDIEMGRQNFERICVNLYKQMDGLMPADEELKQAFIRKIYPKYKDHPKIDILIENTDFGVGD